MVTWLLRILKENIYRVTEHRATLPPWITPPTSHLIKRKETLLRKQQSCPKPEILSKTTNLEEKTKISADKDLKNYELEIFVPRMFSTIQKYLRSIRRAPRLPSIMKLDSKELETDKEKCDAFNQFFCSVFTKAEQKNEISFFEKAKYNHIELLNKDCIEKTMLEQDIKKATGPDNLGNLVYTNLAKTVSKPVLLIFQTFLNRGIFPETGKLSEVVPIFKDGNKCDIKRYRPISLLCCISKIFKKVLFYYIYERVRHHLHNSQYGFRKKISANTQLLAYLHQVYSNYDDQTTKKNNSALSRF